MPHIADIVAFLREQQLSTRDIAGSAPRAIEGVARDHEAVAGELAWISRKNLDREPRRWQRFGGSFLILPEQAVVDSACAFTVALCADPKLAFIRVVGHFFAALSHIDLPQQGQAPIAADAQIGRGVRLGAGCVIGPKVRLGDGVSIGPNTVLANCEVAEGVSIGCNCTIGLPGFGYEKDQDGVYWRFPHLGGVRIEAGVEIGSNTCIDRGSLGDTVIGAGSKIDNLVHVAHNVVLGRNTVVIANTMLGGSVSVGDGAWLAPSVTIMNQASIGEGATLGLGAVVLKDVAPRQVIVGNPGKVLEKKPR